VSDDVQLEPEEPTQPRLPRDEIRGRYLGNYALRLFAQEVGVKVDVLRDPGDIGCTVGQAVTRAPHAKRDQAWIIAADIIAGMDGQHIDEGGEA